MFLATVDMKPVSADNQQRPPDHPSAYSRNSYSQCGEDLIIDFVSRQIGVPIRSYFDIGANHPYEFSNTYFFYERGASGLCVEPIPSLAGSFFPCRQRDRVLSNVVSSNPDPHSFHVLQPSTLSTSDSAALERALQTPGASLVETILIPAVTLDSLFAAYGVPDLLCVDVEGGDLDVLASWANEKFRPPILCVEDLEYSMKRRPHAPVGVTEELISRGYMPFANTFINSILVDQRLWLSDQ
jgi:FkbM family methyltransferase